MIHSRRAPATIVSMTRIDETPRAAAPAGIPSRSHCSGRWPPHLLYSSAPSPLSPPLDAMVAFQRLLALLSGGKDSVYATLCARSAGHTVVAAAHITPPGHHVDGDSYMYQAVASEAVASVAAALGLPLHTRPSRGVAVASPQELGYVPTTGDEVEDLTALLVDAKAAVAAAAKDSTGGGPLTGVVVGALWSDYQRLRVESAAARAGLLVVAPLWRAEQGRLLRRMAAYGLAPVVVKVGAMGLRVSDVGAPLMGLLDRLDRLSELYGVHVAGEGGEYESLVLDAPAFVSRVVLGRVQVAVDREDKWAPTARLLIHEVTSVAKDGGAGALPVLPPEPAAFGGGRGEDLAQVIAVAAADADAWARADPTRWAAAVAAADAAPTDATAAAASSGGSADEAAAGAPLPEVATHVATSSCGGYAHVSVTATTRAPKDALIDAADDAAATTATATTAAAMAAATAAVTAALAAFSWSPADAVAVFVALPTCAPAVYAASNAVYAASWPPAVVNPPPTRAAVAVGGPSPPPPSPADEDANGGGAATDAAVTAVTVEVALCRDRGTAGLHVQSLSPWAPPCIGPYAQAVMPTGEGVAYLSGALALRQLHIPRALTAAGCAAELEAAKSAKTANAVEAGTVSSPEPPSDDGDDTAAMLAAARQTRATIWNVGATLQAVPGASLASALFVAVFVVRPADAAAAIAAVTRRLGAPAEADGDLHWPPVAAADGVAPPPADGPDSGPVVSAVPTAGLPRDAAVEVVVVAGVPAVAAVTAAAAPAGCRALPPAATAAVGSGGAADPAWGTASWRWASRGGPLTWLALRLRRPARGTNAGRGVTAAALAAAVAVAVASLGNGRVLLSARVWTVATAAAARRLGWAANGGADCGGRGGGGGGNGDGGARGRAVWTVYPSAWVPHDDAAVVHAVVVAPARG